MTAVADETADENDKVEVRMLRMGDVLITGTDEDTKDFVGTIWGDVVDTVK